MIEKNRTEGSAFENILKYHAKRSGFLVEKSLLSCRILPGGKVRVCKSELDFKIITPRGRVGYVDAKSWSNNTVPYSKFDRDQVSRAILYNDWLVPAGFVCWWRGLNQVTYLTGHEIAENGPGSSFSPNDGVRLGNFHEIDLKPIFERRLSDRFVLRY